MSIKALVALAAGMLAAAVSPAQAWPGCEVDRVSAVVRGDTLTVHHDAAAYNCCMDSTTYSVSQSADSIRILETEVVTTPCSCLCCYNLSVEMRDLAPGTYTLVFTWLDSDDGQWAEWTTQVTVAGSGGQPFVASTTNSGCYDPVAAPDGAESGSWGRVKSLYR